VEAELTLARIKAIVGEERVGAVELVDTHRPDAFKKGTDAFFAPPAKNASVPFGARRFRPARGASVALVQGSRGLSPPMAFAARSGIRRPWRTSGDWWTTNPWARDEWDIASAMARSNRIYCEPRGWFVEGSYD